MTPLDGSQPNVNAFVAESVANAATELRRELSFVELELEMAHRQARMLPAVTLRSRVGERDRMEQALRKGQAPRATWERIEGTAATQELRVIDRLRRRVADLPVVGPLYVARMDELELELCMLESVGRERAVRPLAARRFGTGEAAAPARLGGTLASWAKRIISQVPPSREERTVPARAFRASRCLAGMMETLARSADLDVRVVVDSRLVAGAATGERTIYVADRLFGEREARRLAVHEVLGHLWAAANGRKQPLRLLEWGTAGSFADQEGVALCLEASAGLMGPERLRTLAGRVRATDLMHAGASFGDTAMQLVRSDGFAADEAIAMTERAYRGGGIARDASYLDGYLRVRDAIQHREADLHHLRAGRLSVRALPHLRTLAALGLYFEPAQRPNLARSFCSTSSGTTPVKLPPNDAASLMRLELT